MKHNKINEIKNLIDNPQSTEDVEQLIHTYWQQSNEAEASLMIGLMEKTPSTYWLNILAKAESHKIKHWELLLKNSDHIYESAAEATAEKDDIVIIPE